MTRQKGFSTRTALWTALVFVILGSGSAARAQWPSDPMVNLAIADRGGEQVLPKIASTPDRGCYVAWFDQAFGSYAVYLQRLDRDGNEQWPHNGILISNHSQSSSLVEWDLISDSDGNAVLVFTDTRSGDDLDVFAYKVSPQGGMLWGPDGIALSDNDAFEPSPRVCQAADGDLVFVWMHYPDTGDGAILMQRLSPEGIERLPHGGFAVITSPNEDPGFASVIPSGQSGVIVLWLRNIRSYTSPRHIMANRFDAAGNALWGAHRFVFDFTSVPMGYWPGIQPDGQGGALVWWHRSASNMFNSMVQHLDVNGAEAFAHNGVLVSANTTRHHLDPTLSYRAATGEIFVFWDERNSAQSQWGVYGQKFSAAGLRQWGDEGRVLLPVNTVHKLFARSAPYDDGAMVFFLEEPSSGLHRVLGLRVDNSGALVWPGPYIQVSSRLSGKGRLPITQDAGGVVKLVWEDNRNGTIDVFGQNVNPEGTLGPQPAGLEEAAFENPSDGNPVVHLSIQPNPAHGSCEIRCSLSGAPGVSQPGEGTLRIYDPRGRLVRSLRCGPGAGFDFSWNGLDDSGRDLAPGAYFLRFDAGAAIHGSGTAILLP